jgi:hypothetical protein
MNEYDMKEKKNELSNKKRPSHIHTHTHSLYMFRNHSCEWVMDGSMSEKERKREREREQKKYLPNTAFISFFFWLIGIDKSIYEIYNVMREKKSWSAYQS